MNFATKLLLGSISALAATSTLNSLYSYRVSEAELREEFARDSEAVAERIAAEMTPVLGSSQEVCRLAKEAMNLQGLRHLVVSQGPKTLCQFGQAPNVRLDLSSPEASRTAVENSRVFTTYASARCETSGCEPLDLEVGISFARLDTSLNLLWRNFVQSTLALILGASGFLFLFSMVVRRRLNKLTEACAKIQKGNWDLQLKLGGRDEISRVAEAMNEMAREIKAASEDKDRQRQALMQTSKMSALGEMAGGIAHEINNPLAIIKINTDHLAELMQEEPLDKKLVTEMAATINRTCDRISKIVLGLRTFSRDGSSDPFEKVAVATLIENTLALCQDRFKHREIKLQVEGAAPELSFEGRSTQISQVLLNLLNNAHDAVAASAEPNKWVRIAVAEAGDTLEIRVSDSNKGIPPDIQKKMFQPFFTTKEVGKGTGMGLSISLGIIKTHQGELTLDTSSPNTCFLIRLPKKQKKLAA